MSKHFVKSPSWCEVLHLLLMANLVLCAFSFKAQAADDGPFKPLFSDPSFFEEALNRETQGSKSSRVTGLIVPHHILAADLIARAFRAAAGNDYDRIIIMSPDHFNRSKRPFATTTRDIDTVFGMVENDRAATTALLAAADLFEQSDLFSNEHGVAALLPFIKRLFPKAKIVPIAISYGSTRPDWDRAYTVLDTLVGPHTLVVQSTDFSHYLTSGEAVKRDQESLNVLSAGDQEAVNGLIQPDHLDSKGAFYIQMRLQDRMKSRPTVIANRNAVEYEPSAKQTTSYIVAAYSPDNSPVFNYADQAVVMLGGDVFAGRGFTEALADNARFRMLVANVLAITHSVPLIVNLEGVILDEIPPNVPHDLHAMDEGLAIPLLHALNVEAVSLANNHSFDLGAVGLASSRAILKRANIRSLPQGSIVDLGPLRAVTLNSVSGRPDKDYRLAGPSEIDAICGSSARPPVIAFIHWGIEYVNRASETEDATAASLRACGVSAVVGAHSHKASLGLAAPAGGEYLTLYSLGNFIFDQSSPRSSGALLEMRFFHQGTFAARLIPIPNFFDQMRSQPGGSQLGTK